MLLKAMLTTGNRKLTVTAALLLAAGLAGCDTTDDGVSRAFVAPGKFTLYNCVQLAQRTQTAIEREQELRALMAKASTDSAGRFISAMAYRPEYLVNHGQLMELRSVAAEKNCRNRPTLVPGQPLPRGRISDTIIR